MKTTRLKKNGLTLLISLPSQELKTLTVCFNLDQKYLKQKHLTHPSFS